MNILYYDCFAGISGDMNLAAMIDLGVEVDHLRAELSKLGLDHEFELRVTQDSRHGIHGTRVDVVLAGLAGHEHGPEHGHVDSHEHADSHAHAHAHAHAHEHAHEHVHGHGHEHAAGDAHADGHSHGHCPDHGHADGHSHEHSHSHNPDHGHADGHGHGHGHANAHAHEHVNAHGHAHAHEHSHGHNHAHAPGQACAHPPEGQGGQHHGHAPRPGGRPRGHAPHRNLADIEAIINSSALSQAVKQTSLAIFRKVAQAEAKVHAKPLYEVHFHEVGATDSIVDIVGAAICFHRLGVDAVWASPVELGGGFVRCAHGVVPVPAPATAEILSGIPTTRGQARHEAATPTGAAILAALADDFPQAPAMVTHKTGYGIGHRHADIPNVLRVHLARPGANQGVGTVQDARLLQCNIDDMTAETLGVAMDLLMENGAMDVHFTPIQMKKNRPATCLSLLCAAADEERFKRLLFRHTSTLGIKSFALDKTVLDIAFERLDTPLGPVTMKNALLDGRVVRSKPELEDCRELAKRHGLPLSEVYDAIAGCRRREASS